MTGEILAQQHPIRIKQCRHGLFMYNINDKYVGRALDVYGEFSELETGLFSQLIQPGMTVLDIGANLGAHTVHFGKLVGPGGNVVAFEPQRVVYQMLCGNVAMNGLTNVSALMAALGNHSGQITVPTVDYSKEDNFGGVTLGDYRGGEVVPLLTLDSFNLPQCHFIKIDVEGMEQAVLEGAAQTIARHNPVLYVENDRPEKSEALIRHLLAKGYRLYWHTPPLFNEDNFFGVSENIFPELVSVNMLCLSPKHGAVHIDSDYTIDESNAHLYVLEERRKKYGKK